MLPWHLLLCSPGILSEKLVIDLYKMDETGTALTFPLDLGRLPHTHSRFSVRMFFFFQLSVARSLKVL